MTPDQKKKYYYSFSILCSVISSAATVFINLLIANRYLHADGKTRALFGITELFNFGYQYDIVVLGVISFTLAILSRKANIQNNKKITAFILSIFAITIVFVRVWRLFV